MSAPEAWHVTRTMRTLEMLALRPRSAVEVANAVGVHPRTARRLLNRLLAEGYVTRAGPRHRKYGVTLKLVAVGQHALEHAELVRQALPYVQRLRDEADARAHFGVASYRSALRLIDEHVEDEGAVRTQVAERAPCHASGTGQVLMTYRERWCDSVLSRPLERHTELTLVDPESVRGRLAEVRERGYAVEDGEHVAGLGSIGAPVFDHVGEAVAALGITLTSRRLANEARRLTAMVVLAARGLSESLGYVQGAEAEDKGLSATVLAMVPAARSYAA